jgi:DNA-binding response OmpR family regulator
MNNRTQMVVRAQFRLPNLGSVRLLNQRLGFGSAEVAAGLDVPPPEIEQTEEMESVAGTQISLVKLAEQLEIDLAAPVVSPEESPAQPSKDDSPPPLDLQEEAEIETSPEPPEPGERPEAPKAINSLEGCRIAALGFGRQDFGSLASTMMEQRARIEFLPRGETVRHAEFDLLILNAGSIETFKKEIASFRAILSSGTPSIVIGSRAVLTLLRDMADPRIWDFVGKPFHMDELVWRSVNLITRNQEAGLPRQLPARVVVADNDAFTRTLVESAMKRLGVECELAEDGEAAWKSIEKSQPGAVILDLTLPNRDGFQLMADIRRSPGRKPKIIVLSARQSEADILRAFALGADDYVTKPFSPLELSARLMRALGVGPENA